MLTMLERMLEGRVTEKVAATEFVVTMHTLPIVKDLVVTMLYNT